MLDKWYAGTLDKKGRSVYDNAYPQMKGRMKKMKKITALVLALMMACLMTCAFAAEADPLYTGEWYLKTMQNGDETIDVAAMGLNGVMTLNADWTCSMTGMGNDVTGTWKDEADKNKITVTMDGDDADVMLSDGELTVSAGETKMIFTREAPRLPSEITSRHCITSSIRESRPSSSPSPTHPK